MKNFNSFLRKQYKVRTEVCIFKLTNENIGDIFPHTTATEYCYFFTGQTCVKLTRELDWVTSE